MRELFKLLAKHLGRGKTCRGCRRLRDTIEVKLIRVPPGEQEQIVSARLCQDCLDRGAEIGFYIPRPPDLAASKQRLKNIRDSRASEEKLSNLIGGKAQPASGATRLAGFKGDVRKIGYWRMEHKFTRSARTYQLHLADIAQIVGLAADAGEYPALVIEFKSVGESFAVIPLPILLELIDAQDQKDSRSEKGKRRRR